MGAIKKGVPENTPISSNYRSTGESFTTNQIYDKKALKGQLYRVFESFKVVPKTIIMVEVETGIMRPNICRYVKMFRKSESIQMIDRKLCKISKHRLGYLTTNIERFQPTNQLNLFE